MGKEFNWEKCGALGQWILGIIAIFLWWIDHRAKSTEPTDVVADPQMTTMQWAPFALIALAFLVGALLHLKAATVANRRKPLDPPLPGQTHDHLEIADTAPNRKAREILNKLSALQKFAVRLVYDHTRLTDLSSQLRECGIPSQFAQSIAAHVEHTSLLKRDSTGIEPNPAVASAVEVMIREIPSAEVVKSIITDITEVVTTTLTTEHVRQIERVAHDADCDRIKALSDQRQSFRESLFDMRVLVEKAGMLRSKAGQADWMFRRLEEIWYIYDNDKASNEGPLAKPLSGQAIPDVVKEERHKQLWAFRVLYISHISALKEIDPEFQSNLVDEGFPTEESYLMVRRKIEAHAGFLRDRVDRILMDAMGAT